MTAVMHAVSIQSSCVISETSDQILMNFGIYVVSTLKVVGQI